MKEVWILIFLSYSAAGLVLGWWKLLPSQEECLKQKAEITQRAELIPPVDSIFIISCERGK